MGRSILSAFFLFLLLDCRSQDTEANTWYRIDTMIAEKKDLSIAYDLLEQFRIKAWTAKKYLPAARCYYYQLLITDLRTEDTAWFRNSAFIDSFLMTQQDNKELQWIMHLLQAKRLTAFSTKYLRFIRQRYERNDIPVNYAAYSTPELDSIALYHFEQAKKIVKDLAPTDIADALWLSSDPLLFLFKPGLFDIVIAEQIRRIKVNSLYANPPSDRQIKLLQLSQDDFIKKMDSLYTAGKENFIQLKYYEEWLSYHRSSPAIYYFIETLARKFTHEVIKGPGYRNAGSDGYETYLEKIISSPYNMVKAHGIYQLCLLWNQQAKRYSPFGEYGYEYRYSSYQSESDYDTTYRYHAVKALQLFRQNKTILDSFNYLKDILLRLERQILENDVKLTMERNNLPGEPILAELSFKNADKLYYSIRRTNAGFSFGFKTKKELLGKLEQLPEFFNSTIDLPLLDDRNRHAAYIKFDALPPGNYVILFSHLPLNDTSKKIERLFFTVTSIVALNNNKREFVLDRKTGQPLEGARIRAYYDRDARDSTGLKQTPVKEYTVNKQGFAIIKDKKIRRLEISYKNDTISSAADFTYRNRGDDRAEDVYSKDEYEDLIEFYEESARAYVFTDRSIYRPGQTVHFKAIFLTRNKNTGEDMIMSKENMGNSLFRSVYKKWLKESEPLMYLTDPFDREADSIKVRLNDYGSVSGSFKIPKTAATGDWSIYPDYIDGENEDKLFRIEEYKRPSYEINIEKTKKELLPKDTFSVKVRVKSFAGAALNNVQVNYRIKRRGLLPSENVLSADNLLTGVLDDDVTEHLADTMAYTNEEGELNIAIDDSLLRGHSLAKDRRWDFTYIINAEAIDVTGENYKTSTSVAISSRPITIALPFEKNYNRNEKNNVLITATEMNAGKVSKNIRVKIYRIIKQEKLYSDRKLVKADQWIYDKKQLEQWFPLIDIFNKEDTGTKQAVLEATINTGKNEKLELDPLLFEAGNYYIKAVCEENDQLLGENERYFSVYDEKENKLPGATWSFHQLKINSVFPDDTIKYYTGTPMPVYAIYHITWYAGKKKTIIHDSYETNKQEAGIHRFIWKVPADAVDQAIVRRLYVMNNQVFSHEERIFINANVQVQPEIIVEQYRKKLSPGSKETFSVTIKTKNDNTAAELMTTMYDASLEKLEEHKWELPRQERSGYLTTDWNNNINTTTWSINFPGDDYDGGWISVNAVSPLWWIDPGYPSEADVMADWNLQPNRGFFSHDMNPDARWSGSSDNLMGRVSGIQLADTDGLQEVVVVGYSTSTVRKKSLTGSVMRIRGLSTLSGYRQPLIILDGIPFSGDLSKLDPSIITQAMILKGADGTNIWGAQADNGVLVLSTKGDIVLPDLLPVPVVPPRKNFNETAFFFPAVYADKDGYYNFSFTMPESVTEWNWKMLAHTKKAKFVYAERKLSTQLPLMVQPNMPRLLYQGDRIILQSRVSNLDSTDAAGKAVCRIEDVVTGEDITALWLGKMQNDFSVTKKTNISTAFEIRVPKTQLNPVKIIVSVRSQNFSDGEEHIIPVLSPKMLVRENIPFRFSKNTDTVVQAISLHADAELYGVGVSIMPKPQSALLHALPWQANYSYDCAEQTFNKLLAHATALKIMRVDEEGQRAFNKAKESVEKHPESGEQLPGELSEEAMPWLNAGNKNASLQKQLFELLDTSRTESQVKKHLNKLYKLQNDDGGLTWFEGGKSNHYISCYVLAGFGKLAREGLIIPVNLFNERYKVFKEKLQAYCHNAFQSTGSEKNTFNDPLIYAYARSFWTEKYPLTDSAMQDVRDMLNEIWKKAGSSSLHHQAMLIITTLRYFDKQSPGYKRAVQQLNSIEELAIRDDVNGIRWKDLADSDDMNNGAEETIVMIADAFSEAGIHGGISQGILKWLLTVKNDDHWSSTKATSAVIGMLTKENNTATGLSQAIHSTINNKDLSVTDDLLSGNSFSFVKAASPMPVTLKKQNSTVAAGSLTWYYFAEAADLSKTNKEVNLVKQVYRYANASAQWEPVNEKTVLRIADKIKVVLTVETARALRYIYIDDKRAAAFEPRENHSGYRYGEGISYYQSVRDAGIQFFTDFIPSGRSTISYEMTVAQEGQFTNGPASLQCMYRPAINAYSGSMRVQTIK